MQHNAAHRIESPRLREFTLSHERPKGIDSLCLISTLKSSAIDLKVNAGCERHAAIIDRVSPVLLVAEGFDGL